MPPQLPAAQVTEIALGIRPDGHRATLIEAVRAAIHGALAGTIRLDPDLLVISGMSGRKYRMFINALIGRLADPRYLEVGCWTGSTLCAAVNGHQVTALAIDNWSEFGAPRGAFWGHLARFCTPGVQLRFLESDFREVDFTACGRFNVYLFDGPHEPQDQYDGIMLAQPALDDDFVLVIDDWNWPRVRTATLQALERIGLDIIYMLEIRTSLDDGHAAIAFQDSDWHNGYFIGVISKRA